MVTLVKTNSVRTKLTDAEYNAVMHLTASTKIDHEFDITDCGEQDMWRDWDSEADVQFVDLKTGFTWLSDSLAYPLTHENLTDEECLLIANCIKEFVGISDREYNYLLSKEN